MQIVPKGEGITLPDSAAHGTVHATLSWETSVDLDLHCFAEGKGSPPKKAGFFGGLFGGGGKAASNVVAHVSFSNKRSPGIQLDQDSGVGDTLAGSRNEENIHFDSEALTRYGKLHIVANIFGKTTNFGQYNGWVDVKCGDETLRVPLDSTETGSWAHVATIDNTGNTPRLLNMNSISSKSPF